MSNFYTSEYTQYLLDHLDHPDHPVAENYWSRAIPALEGYNPTTPMPENYTPELMWQEILLLRCQLALAANRIVEVDPEINNILSKSTAVCPSYSNYVARTDGERCYNTVLEPAVRIPVRWNGDRTVTEDAKLPAPLAPLAPVDSISTGPLHTPAILLR